MLRAKIRVTNQKDLIQFNLATQNNLINKGKRIKFQKVPAKKIGSRLLRQNSIREQCS